MAIIEEGITLGGVVKVLAIGVGVIILAPAVLPALKPIAKAAIKGGLMLYEKGKESFSEVGEVVEDLVAEAKAEMAEAQEGAEAAPAAEGEAAPAAAAGA